MERVDMAVGENTRDARDTRRVLVVAVTASEYSAALRLAQQLRTIPRLGVEQDVRLRGVKAALRYADRANFDMVVVIGERELAEQRALVRDMRTREERSAPLTEVQDAVREALK